MGPRGCIRGRQTGLRLKEFDRGQIAGSAARAGEGGGAAGPDQGEAGQVQGGGDNSDDHNSDDHISDDCISDDCISDYISEGWPSTRRR